MTNPVSGQRNKDHTLHKDTSLKPSPLMLEDKRSEKRSYMETIILEGNGSNGKKCSLIAINYSKMRHPNT